jgi:hypothetical protein
MSSAAVRDALTTAWSEVFKERPRQIAAAKLRESVEAAMGKTKGAVREAKVKQLGDTFTQEFDFLNTPAPGASQWLGAYLEYNDLTIATAHYFQVDMSAMRYLRKVGELFGIAPKEFPIVQTHLKRETDANYFDPIKACQTAEFLINCGEFEEGKNLFQDNETRINSGEAHYYGDINYIFHDYKKYMEKYYFNEETVQLKS